MLGRKPVLITALIAVLSLFAAAQQETTGNGDLFLFGYGGRFLQIGVTDQVEIKAFWRLSDVKGNADIPNHCDQGRQSCAWVPKFVQYSPELNSFFAVVPTKEAIGIATSGDYNIVALRASDMSQVAIYTIRQSVAVPKLLLAPSGRFLLVSYQKKSSIANHWTQFLEWLDPATLKRVNQKTDELDLKAYRLAEVSPGLNLTEKAHFGPSADIIYDVLTRIEIRDGNFVRTQVNPVKSLSDNQKQILKPYAQIDPPTGKLWYNYTEIDSAANRTVLMLRSADGTHMAVWTVNLDTGDPSPILVVPFGRIRLSPDGKNILVNDAKLSSTGKPSGVSEDVAVYQVDTGKELRRISNPLFAGAEHDHRIVCLAPDASAFVYAAGQELFVINLLSQTRVRTAFTAEPGTSCVFDGINRSRD